MFCLVRAFVIMDIFSFDPGFLLIIQERLKKLVEKMCQFFIFKINKEYYLFYNCKIIFIFSYVMLSYLMFKIKIKHLFCGLYHEF